MLKLDDLVKVLILEEECERQVACHIATCFASPLVLKPLFVLVALMLLLLEIFVDFELKSEFLRGALLDQLQVIARFVLIDTHFQVDFLDKVGARFSRLEVVHEGVLGHCELDSVA